MQLYGLVFGIIIMIICDLLVRNGLRSKNMSEKTLLQTGIAVSIGLAIHNFPEGLAIGSGCDASIQLGVSLALAIAIHDIPEGISMAVPMKNGGMSARKVVHFVVLSGFTTGVGAFLGAVIGNISEQVIATCLAFAAGAMLYIVSGELIPESNKLYMGRMNTIGNIVGFIIGIFATNFI